MKAYFANLNPVERRFVVGVALLLFIVINAFIVWPHFSDWNTFQERLDRAQTKQRIYERAIQQTNALRAQIEKLGGEDSNVPREDQAMQFYGVIQRQMNASGVGLEGNSPMIMRTNEFFVEQEQTIRMRSGEQQLVDFLYKLGSGNSLIRVKSMSVQPDASRQNLGAQVTLVASYQKNPRAHPAAKPAAAPASRPATPPVAKPANQKIPTPTKK